MIKHWQSMQDYKHFLTESKAHFDSSERNRLHTELWKIWQKLWLFDTDRAMEFLLPFYSATGRPARNQPQILRSFILFFFLYSEGLAKPSLTLWADRLKDDRVLASLIGCTQDSLPPLGSYFDFMDRLWAAPATGLYARDKLLPASWNRKKPDRPKGRHQKAQETKHKITESIEKRLMAGKDIPSTLNSACSSSSTMWLSFLPGNAASYHRSTLLSPGTEPLYIPTPAPTGITGMALRTACGISLTLMRPGAGTATWTSITSATLCSSCPAIMRNLRRTSPCSCASPAQNGMIPSASWSLSTNWKSICRLFPLRTCAWTLQWTITPPTGFSGKRKYGHSSTSTTNAAGQKQSLIPSPLTKMGHHYARKSCA